jgi:hypothetical protein
MYSRKAWGGAVDPHILVKFIKETAENDSDPIASMVIFEWKDYDLVGVLPAGDSIQVFLQDGHRITRVNAYFYYRGNISAMRKQ